MGHFDGAEVNCKHLTPLADFNRDQTGLSVYVGVCVYPVPDQDNFALCLV